MHVTTLTKALRMLSPALIRYCTNVCNHDFLFCWCMYSFLLADASETECAFIVFQLKLVTAFHHAVDSSTPCVLAHVRNGEVHSYRWRERGSKSGCWCVASRRWCVLSAVWSAITLFDRACRSAYRYIHILFQARVPSAALDQIMKTYY